MIVSKDTVVNQSKVGKGLWKPVLVILFLLTVLILFGTVLEDELFAAVEYLRTTGPLGAFLYSLFFFGILVGIPSTVLEIGAAIIFLDGYVAFAVSTVAKNLMCWLAFGFAKFCFRQWVEEHVLKSEKLIVRGFKRAFKENPIKIAFLWAGSYLPIWSTNYGLASIGCSFRLFALATFLVGLPYSTLWVFVGQATRAAIDSSSNEAIDQAQLAALIIAILVLVIGILAVLWYVRKSVRQIIEDEKEAEEAEGAVAEEEELEPGAQNSRTTVGVMNNETTKSV